MAEWQFWIDVGGTFTDCIGIEPCGAIHTLKTLSSGVTTGRGRIAENPAILCDPGRVKDPPGFWNQATLRIRNPLTASHFETTVLHFDAAAGTLLLREAIPAEWIPIGEPRISYELSTKWHAPVLAIRYLLRLPFDEICPPVQVRFGTTRGTNALLTRTGARVVLLTTRGFADVPLIGNQTRPDLFALDIVKPRTLFSDVIEVHERIASNGTVLLPFTSETDHARLLVEQLRQLRQAGCGSVAICLMNAWLNDAHERRLEDLARDAGFDEISRSSEVSPVIRFVERCSTTTLDAYLNPVLRSYLDGIGEQLPGSSLQVMTSAGGLVQRDRFRGRDCILSGPAGGIVGFAQAAMQCGYRRAIGFDMGGTSTDVARFDERFEFENESTKAGVSILTPVLSIETVAAGGGSICGFDGVRLFVGPASAGADPGPACYGRGGPLTVTDLNVFLGRVLPDRFPFQLDSVAVEQRLTELRDHMARQGNAHVDASLYELAEGLLQIANDNMAHAVRRVSVAKGYDPAEYLLVCFGGAGGQHACAVARRLGMHRVLLHPLAGILSAYGMGHAPVRSVRQFSVLKELSPDLLNQERDSIHEAAVAVIDEIKGQGIAASQIEPPELWLELRYRGADSTIPVAAGSAEAPADSLELIRTFEAEHHRLYGYTRNQRAVEVAALRVEAVGKNVTPPPESGRQWTCPQAALEDLNEASVGISWFGHQPCRTGILDEVSLMPGHQITGPAVVCTSNSTVVIDPWSRAHVLEDRSLLIEVGDCPAPDGAIAADEVAESSGDFVIDPVQIEIYSNQFASIAEQMGEMLRRTAISTNVRERLDYSCALFDRDGQLVVNAPHVPVHLGAMGETVRAVMEDHPDLQPGDVIVTNDPFRGGSHLPDITVVTPVFVVGGTHQQSPVAWVANRAHHAEIGGIVPGSMPPFSKCLAEEGVLIRSRHLVRRGESCEDELRDLLGSAEFPSRAVEDNLADLAAQVAANACGVSLLQDLMRRHSPERLNLAMRQIQEASAGKLRQALSALPDGEYAFRDELDDGSLVCVQIRVRGDQARIDFSGSSAVHSGNLNANRAITTAAVLYSLRCFLADPVPLNAGVLEPVEIVIPDGLLNPAPGADPHTSPAVVGGNVETSQRIVDVLFGALRLAAASQGTMNNLTFGDATFGYYETICGGAGGTPNAPGASAVHTHMTNTRLTDPEVLEQRYPVHVRQFAIRTGSGGAGLHGGGDGIIRELQFWKPLQVSMLAQRRTRRPYGLAGGLQGCEGAVHHRGADGVTRRLDGCFSLTVSAGDSLIIETPGGGGWGESRR
ncbi:MAG: hydantoinase B/oxoprolinase family protein [Planctomycetaceae bacterium]|nr:hydantoinase B/oxoprolinase family protein [Planctomycetaceae bacterium]